MKLAIQNNFAEQDELKEEEYMVFTRYHTGEKCGLAFKCRGCGKTVTISNGPEKPKWDINFETLTATPSIVHSPEKGGCGWHGYLTDAELKPC